MSDRRRAGRLVVPTEQAPADKALLERDAIEELSHHADPWRVLRIQSEFVEGFGGLAELGPAISVFGSARTTIPPGSTPDREATGDLSRRVHPGLAAKSSGRNLPVSNLRFRRLW